MSAAVAGTAREAAVCDLAGEAQPVRSGRRFVHAQAEARGARALLDDAALVAAELLTNAVLHGHGQVSVRVAGDGACLRIEVLDDNPRPPVIPAPSTVNMTGRGIALVTSLAARWGVEPTVGGKVVWAELEPGADEGGSQATAEPAVDRVVDLGSWPEPIAPPADLLTVSLGDVPTELLIAAKAHIDNIVRELSLAATGDQAVPDHLVSLIRRVVHGFADARDAIKRQALAALARGDARTNLVLRLPLSAARAGEAYLAGLDEADAYARAARLLTMEAPPAHRLFRRWYVESVVTQLRAAAVGERAPAVVPFEDRMLQEIGRLATLQRSTDRAARLQRVTAALAGARTPQDVASVVVGEGVTALEASGGSLLVPADDGVHMAVPGVVGYHRDLVDALREERLDAPLPAAMVIRTGEAVWLESREERDALFPALRGFEASTVSMCAVPLVVAGVTVGALRFSFASRRLFDDDERAFVLALAALTAQTLARTERYAAERRTSLELQRALLPAQPAQIPGWGVAAFYSPAGRHEAGGDFYDVLALDDGRVVAVLGDVMGRGVAAAAAMAEVRTMIRSYALLDPDPAEVFRRVDEFFRVCDLSQLVTVLYCLVEPDTGTVTVGNAGHLPPVLRTGAGARLLVTSVGTPFGVGGVRRETTSVVLGAGEALVAVTDGVVERRGEDIDVGLERAMQALGRPGARTARQLVDAVVSAALGDEVHDDDDTTVLVLQRGLPPARSA